MCNNRFVKTKNALDVETTMSADTRRVASNSIFRGKLVIKDANSTDTKTVSVEDGMSNKELYAEVSKIFNEPVESLRLIHSGYEIPLDNESLTKEKYSTENTITLVIRNNLYKCTDANNVTTSQLKEFLIRKFIPESVTTTQYNVDDDKNGVNIMFTKLGDRWNFVLQKKDGTSADLADIAKPYIAEICGQKKAKYEDLTDVKTFRLWVAFKEYVKFPTSFARDVKYLPSFLRSDAEDNKATAWAVFSYAKIVAYIELLISQQTDEATIERLRRVIGKIENGTLWKPDAVQFHVTGSTPIEATKALEDCKDTIYKDVVPAALANVFRSESSASASAVSAISAPISTPSPRASVVSSTSTAFTLSTPSQISKPITSISGF